MPQLQAQPGAVDPAFDPGSGVGWEVRTLAQRDDGRVVFGGSFTSVDAAPRTNFAQLVGDPAAAPEVTTQPANRNITVEQDATFFVELSGVPAPAFQWRLCFRWQGADAFEVEMWTGLQADYDLRLARYETQRQIEREVEPLVALQPATA